MGQQTQLGIAALTLPDFVLAEHERQTHQPCTPYDESGDVNRLDEGENHLRPGSGQCRRRA